MPVRKVPEKFLIAFSLAGEQRELVRSIAKAVETKLGQATVFLDEWFEHLIAGHDGELKLQNIYRKQCELVVVCVSEHYGGKSWTRAEHEAVRARQMELRESKVDRDQFRILPIRVGEGEVEGILFNTIVPDVRTRPVTQTAKLILDRLSLIQPPNNLETKGETRVRYSWPKKPARFQLRLAGRTGREWPAVLRLLTSDAQKRILIFKGLSGYSKSALLGAADKYARTLPVPRAFVDFKDTNLLSIANVLREFQMGLDHVLPEFALEKNPDRWALRQALRALHEPALILLDTYEKVVEIKELVEWIENQLLAEAEECEHLRFIIGGQKIPDSAQPRWRDCAEVVELERILDQRVWKDWVQKMNPNVDDKHVEGIVLGLEGLPGPISIALETCAKKLGHPN
jgi:hypothetical protein